MGSRYPDRTRVDADSAPEGRSDGGQLWTTWQQILRLAAETYVRSLRPDEIPNEPWTMAGSVEFLSAAQNELVKATYERTGR